MIRPDGFDGAAFGTALEGDLRIDDGARSLVASALGISDRWAFVTQVHGDRVIVAAEAGRLGDADAIFTTVRGLPVAVATADCVPVVLEGEGLAAVVHVGWRGAAAGVVGAVLRAIARHDLVPRRAAVGPAIGPCCYEVGPEVAERFPEFVSETGWGTTSVDLPGLVVSQFAASGGSIDTIWRSPLCTYTTPELYSYRRNRTEQRQVTVAWLPV
jgi:polyphenol oxidase